MNKKIIPPKLQSGDTVCVISPSKSLATLSNGLIKNATIRLESLGLKVVFGKHTKELDTFNSSPVASRIEDIHEAFADTSIKGIIAAIGGFNANQLLRHIDWELIRKNPKIFCGYSDITTLLTAMYTKTGLITYSGPNFASFGDPLQYAYTVEYFKKCLMQDGPYIISPSKEWSNIKLTEKKQVHVNEGYWIMQEGEAEGCVLGENLVTFDFLKGTEYFPHIENSILFLEDDFNNTPQDIDEHLEALIIDKKFKHIRGIVFGRFQEQSNITREVLNEIIFPKSELQNMPILANVDFGHTEPKFTFPFGGKAKISAFKHTSLIQVLLH